MMGKKQHDVFKIFSVGWSASHIEYLLTPIANRTGIQFIHGSVETENQIKQAIKKYPYLNFVALSGLNSKKLPSANLTLLAGLESVGVPTLRAMIRGDRVLRFRPVEESQRYATILAKKMLTAFKEHKPDVILASNDSMHSAISLAVAKQLGIPWVAMAFTIIPDNRTAFQNALTPNSLVPILQPIDDNLRSEARQLLNSVCTDTYKVLAYQAPTSLLQWLRQLATHAHNLIHHYVEFKFSSSNHYLYETNFERARDILRRSINRLRFPQKKMLKAPPQGCYAYYPMHMAPESMLDTWAPFYQDQLGFIERLSLVIPADMDLVVKLHFSDPDNYSKSQLIRLFKLPRVHVAHPGSPGSEFLKQADLVIGITGTSSIEAALRGKTVLIFGDSPYVNFPSSERAGHPDALFKQIKRMLAKQPPSEEEIIDAYAAYLARYMPGRINDWSKPITEGESQRYAECFQALRKYVEDEQNTINWYSATK